MKLILLACMLGLASASGPGGTAQSQERKDMYWKMAADVREYQANEGKAVCGRTANDYETRAKRCGGANVFRVVDGCNAKKQEFTYQVGMYIQMSASGSGLCGGTLISKDVVSTAAHCINGLPLNKGYKIRMWMGTERIDRKKMVTMDVSAAIMHPMYNPRTQAYDHALIRLPKALTYTADSDIAPACLRDCQSDLGQAECVVSGWGTTRSGGRTSQKLLFVPLEIIPDEHCPQSLIGYSGGSQVKMCAAGKGKKHDGKLLSQEKLQADSCQGDSGGPLACYSRDEKKWFLTGVVSYGVGCGGEQIQGMKFAPGVYADAYVMLLTPQELEDVDMRNKCKPNTQYINWDVDELINGQPGPAPPTPKPKPTPKPVVGCESEPITKDDDLISGTITLSVGEKKARTSVKNMRKRCYANLLKPCDPDVPPSTCKAARTADMNNLKNGFCCNGQQCMGFPSIGYSAKLCILPGMMSLLMP